MAWIDTPLTTYTPTVTQSGSVTVTVNYAVYSRSGAFVFVNVHVSVTGSGTTNNAIVISLPVALAGSVDSARNIGSGTIVDQSAGTHYHGYLVPQSTTTVSVLRDNTGNYVGIVPNFGLASGDRISFFAVYPV